MRTRRLALSGVRMNAIWCMRIRMWIALCAIGVLSPSIRAQSTAVSFGEVVAPILQEHCVACHCAKRTEGGYRLDTVDGMLLPGDGGLAPVVSGKSAESEIVQRMRSHDPDVRMPAESDPLPAELIDRIAAWIDAGAGLEGIARKDPLWSVIPPKQYPAPPEHYAQSVPVTAIAFNADGTQIVSSGYHEALVWNASTGALVQRWPNQSERIHSIVAAPELGAWFLAGGTPGAIGEVRWLDAASGSVLQVIARSNDVALDAALRPGKKELAVALADNTIRLIDLERREQRKLIASHADWVTQLAYSEDGKRLGASSRDKSAKVYDAESGDLLASYPGHQSAVRGIAAIGDGSQWMTVGGNQQWHRWEVEGVKKTAEIGLGSESAKLTQVGTSLFIPGSDGGWRLLDVTKNAIALQPKGHTDWVSAMAVHVATGRVATGSLNGEIRVWNLADGTMLQSWMAKP